jgi:ribosome recycling factor
MPQVTMAAIPALKDSFTQLKTRMDKAVEDFRKEMAATRTGRASVHMLDGVTVDAYGSQMPLNQLANVSAPEPQLITVQAWDVSLIGAVEKAIRSADLGLNPMNDGKLIRVPVPALTEERRKEMVKHLNKVLEEHRTAVRNIRRDGQEDHRGRRARRAGPDPETHRRRNQEDGRAGQGQGEGSAVHLTPSGGQLTRPYKNAP